MKDFKLEDLTLPVEVKTTTTVSRRIAKRREQFVLLPLSLVDKVAQASKDKTFLVLCHLVHETWKAGGGPVKLANGFLAMLGIGRGAKNRALKKLEDLDVISVDRRDRKSPVVQFKAPWGRR